MISILYLALAATIGFSIGAVIGVHLGRLQGMSAMRRSLEP